MFQSNRKKRNAQKVIDPDIDYTKSSVHHVSQWWGLIIFIYILSIGLLSQYMLMRLPNPLKNADQAQYPESFISERAWKDLKIITDFGPRPTGSYSNEELAVDFLKREISYISQLANKNQNILFDKQVVSGAYYLNMKPHGMTNVYRDVQNIIVKLVGKSEGKTNQTLMLNCHFDSVAGSPGASDDAASCTVMLEILRVLSRQEHVNRHTILFLFNGAEETPLQASHGFVSQHPWAKNVKAFLNLESVGSGGKEILFQTGPKNPWLINLYAKYVPYPHAQVAAEEIFQSGLIPSDTDFRIFRDFGYVPGMDFAHVMNGYRYHTKYDHIDYLPLEVLQRTGDNILALTKGIANSEYLDDIEKYSEGSTVFYDFLGLFFIHYSNDIGIMINIIITLMAMAIPFISLSQITRGVHRKFIKKEAIIGFISCIVALGASILFNMLISYQLDSIGKSMSWYAVQYLAVGIYVVPAIIIQSLIYLIMDQLFKNTKAPLSLGLKLQARLNGTNIFWSFLIIGLTLSGYKIGYAIMLPLFIVCVTNFSIFITKLQNSAHKWLFVHMLGQTLILLWTTNLYHLILSIFIPISGRSGAMKNPDVTIGIICAALTFFATSYITPLILLLKKIYNFLGCMLTILGATALIIIFTNIGFPYRDDSVTSPKPQRLFITHSVRTFYDINGHVRYTDSGYWLREMDRNARKTIESLSAPDTPIHQLDNNMCATEAFCGLPLYSCRQLHTGGFWLPGPTPMVRQQTSLKLLSNKQLNSNERRLELTLTGNVLTSFLLRPKPTVKLNHWNILPTIPPPNEFNGEDGYFVMITHGVDGEPMNVTLDLKTEIANYDGPLIDITIVSTHWEYHKEHTPAFIILLKRIPKWAFAVPSVAALEAFTF